MATTTTAQTTAVPEGQCVEWRGLDWNGYTTMLRLRGERSSPRMIYLDGGLYLVSPAYYRHERPKKLVGLFVMVVVEELNIPCFQTGSTTFRRRKKRGGVEGDETFYLTSAEQIRGKTEDMDLRTDPPPDLALEVVNTHAAEVAIEVWRRFRVPEVWVYEDAGLRVLALNADDQYVESEVSVAFPFLKASEIFGWVSKPSTSFDTEWVRELRQWVRDVLAPRRLVPE